jgi:hypothetical protein
MGSCLVEVDHIRIEHALELLLMQDQQMVHAFLSHTPHEAFADRIGSGSVIGRFEKLDATCCRHPSKAGPKFAVVITDQVLRCFPIGGGFSEVLGDAEIGWRSCHADMDHLPRLQFDEEEGKERSKEEIGDLYEVAGPDLCGVVAQKGRPPLAPWLQGANSSHILLDGALTYMDVEFQQFPANALSTEDDDFPSPFA